MARSKRQRQRLVIGVVVTVLIAGGAAAGMAAILHQDTGCNQLTGDPGPNPIRQDLVLELTGNTSKAREEAADFVTHEATLASGGKPVKALVVTIALVQNGVPVTPHYSCLRKRLVLIPSADDVAGYRNPHTSEAAKDQFLSDIKQHRKNQIQWVAEAVSREVASRSFSKPALKWSPLPVWSVAAGSTSNAPDGWIGVLSPVVSTADDCLTQPGGTPDDVGTAVAHCIRFQQLPVLQAGHTSVVIAGSAETTNPNRVAADTLRTALCLKATADNCSVDR